MAEVHRSVLAAPPPRPRCAPHPRRTPAALPPRPSHAPRRVLQSAGARRAPSRPCRIAPPRPRRAPAALHHTRRDPLAAPDAILAGPHRPTPVTRHPAPDRPPPTPPQPAPPRPAPSRPGHLYLPRPAPCPSRRRASLRRASVPCLAVPRRAPVAPPQRTAAAHTERSSMTDFLRRGVTRRVGA